MRRFESKFELTGPLFESEMIGGVDTKNPEYQEALRKTQEEEVKAGTERGYIRFKKAVELAKKFQPYDPTNPDKPFARDIRIALQDLLKLKTEEDMDKIKFYTASGTPLDELHGVDAFVEYEEKEKEEPCRATFDFVIDPRKRIHKSDIRVSEKDLPDPILEEKEYLKKIEEYAKQAVMKMATRQVKEKKIIL